MFQFEAAIGGLPHELELAEYINVPSGKMDLAVTLTRNDEEHFMKIDSILSVELDPYIKESLNKSSAAGKLIFFASHAE